MSFSATHEVKQVMYTADRYSTKSTRWPDQIILKLHVVESLVVIFSEIFKCLLSSFTSCQCQLNTCSNWKTVFALHFTLQQFKPLSLASYRNWKSLILDVVGKWNNLQKILEVCHMKLIDLLSSIKHSPKNNWKHCIDNGWQGLQSS